MVAYNDSFGAILEGLGARGRALRLVRNLSQSELAQQAGIAVMTVHRFEKTGQTSTENLLRIALALGAEAAVSELFAPPPYTSIDEALGRPAVVTRQRAPRKPKRKSEPKPTPRKQP